MPSSEATTGMYIARGIGMFVLLIGACLIAFGGGALYEVLSAAFTAGREVIDDTLWAWLR